MDAQDIVVPRQTETRLRIRAMEQHMDTPFAVQCCSTNDEKDRSVCIESDEGCVAVSSWKTDGEWSHGRKTREGAGEGLGKQYSLSCSASRENVGYEEVSGVTTDGDLNGPALPQGGMGREHGEGCVASWATLPDAIVSMIASCASRSTVLVMRVTCRGWNGAIGRSIRYLQPDSISDPHFVERFPHVSALDLSASDLAMHISPDTGELDTFAGIKDDCLKKIENFHHLQALTLTRCRLLEGHGLRWLHWLYGLQLLDLTGCTGLTDVGLEIGLKYLPQLESLILIECIELSDSAVAMVVETLPVLKRFALPPGTTDTGLGHVATSCSIQRVAIRECHNVSPSGVKQLLKSPSLRRVVVCRCKFVSSKSLSEVTRRLSIMKYESQMHREGRHDSHVSRRRSLDMELMMNSFFN